jgi:hypothetical protein
MVSSISPRPIIDHTMHDEDSPVVFSDEEEAKG